MVRSENLFGRGIIKIVKRLELLGAKCAQCAERIAKDNGGLCCRLCVKSGMADGGGDGFAVERAADAYEIDGYA